MVWISVLQVSHQDCQILWFYCFQDNWQLIPIVDWKVLVCLWYLLCIFLLNKTMLISQLTFCFCAILPFFVALYIAFLQMSKIIVKAKLLSRSPCVICSVLMIYHFKPTSEMDSIDDRKSCSIAQLNNMVITVNCYLTESTQGLYAYLRFHFVSIKFPMQCPKLHASYVSSIYIYIDM